MKRAEALAQVIEALAQDGFNYLVDRDPPTFQGSLVAAGRPFGIELTFPCLRFTRLPRAILTEREVALPGHHPHVESDGAICYAAPGSIVFDMYDPGGSALAVLVLLGQTLERVLSGAADGDLNAEFPQHWNGAPIHLAFTKASQGSRLVGVTVARLGNCTNATVIGRQSNPSTPIDLGLLGSAAPPGFPARIFDTDRPLLLSRGESLPSNLLELADWAERIGSGIGQRILEAAASADSAAYLLVRASNGCVGALTVPRIEWIKSAQRPGFVGRMTREHPSRVAIARLSGKPLDLDYAVGRNLRGRKTLAGKRIALIGCGTIGGHLVKFLAQSGVGIGGGHLDLIDPDTYEAGNVGRHWLSPRHVGSAKASACEDELSAMFLGVSARAHVAHVMDRLDLLRQADLVIDATGEEAVSVAINDEILAAEGGRAASLYVWLAGAGAAAQAFLVPNVRGGQACFRCLRPGPGALSHGDVLLPGTAVDVVPAACGEAAYFPYGVGAPAIAAGLAAHMALEWAGGVRSPTLRTVRIDLAATRAVDDVEVPADPACAACGAR